MNKLSLRVLNKIGLLDHLNLTGKLVLNNQKFRIPVIQKTGLDNMFMSEPWMIDLLKLILKKEDTCFVDIGVNVGQTLLKLRSVSDTVNYIGFEPNPLCVFYVNRLIQENKFRNCHLIPVGVSDSTQIGTLNFFSNSVTDSTATIISDSQADQRIIRKEYVPLFQIEQLKDQIGLHAISVLKIDVEGAELEVLKSFHSLIKQSKPTIFIEILPAYSETNAYRIQRQNEIVQMMTDSGYSIYRVMKQNDQFLHLNKISTIEVHSDLNQCEYVMISNDKKELVKNCLK